MEVKVNAPPRVVIITLVGESDIVALRYLLENVNKAALESTFWETCGAKILRKLGPL